MLAGNAAAVVAELCSQALAFRDEFEYYVPVVATDLSKAIRAWRLEGQLLVEFLNPHGSALSLDEGMHIVWEFMRKQIRTVSAWRDTKKRDPGSREVPGGRRRICRGLLCPLCRAWGYPCGRGPCILLGRCGQSRCDRGDASRRALDPFRTRQDKCDIRG